MISLNWKNVALVGLVLIGISRPVFSRINVTADWITLLSVSPLTHVFSSHHFFTKIRVFLQYDGHQDEVPWHELFDLSNEGVNIYSGKMRYNLFFMESTLGERQARAVARFFFCDPDERASLLKGRRAPLSIRILYENRADGKALKDVHYTCLPK